MKTQGESGRQRAIILFGHGSRDPLWRLPMETVAARLRAAQPGVPVRCAFLELEAPDLGAAADDLAASGVQELRIVPMFLGTGRHAREDLPLLVDQIRNRHPQLRVLLQRAIGEDDRVLDLIARIASE